MNSLAANTGLVDIEQQDSPENQDLGGTGLRGRLGFLLKDSVLYGGAAALSKAFALLTFPILARSFSVAEYGLFDYFSVVASSLSIFLIFGQDSAVARFFYEHTELAERRQILSQSLMFQLLVMACVLPTIWIASNLYTTAINPHSNQLLKLVLLQVPFVVLLQNAQGILKWTFARRPYLILSLGSVVVHASALIAILFFFEVSLPAVFILSLCIQAAFGILGLYLIRNWLVVPRGLDYQRTLLPYAAPFGVICVIGTVTPLIERSLIMQSLGTHEVGLYAAGAKVAMLTMMLGSAFQTAWGPFSLAIHRELNAAETYNWVLRIFAIGMSVCVLLLSSSGGLLISVLATSKYAGAGVVIFPLAMGIAVKSTSWISEIGIVLSKKSYLNLISYSVSFAVTLAAIAALTEPYGLLGVASGVMLGQVALAIVGSWLGQRVYPLAWSYGPVVTTLLLTMAFGLGGSYAVHKGQNFAGTAIFLSGTLVVILYGLFGAFDMADRERMIRHMAAFARRAKLLRW